jgi:lysophospholipase L1-like esterase
MESLKSAVERAKEGGRPLTITQIGDSHIAFGMETPAIAAKLAADFGLKPDQIRFSSIGDVGKTASYAKDHPGEFMKNIDQNADLVIVSFGSNEATKQEGAQYSHDYGALIDQIKSRDPNGAIAMIGPTDGNFWNTQRHLPGLASVTQSQEGVAAGVSNGAYFEVAPNMGSVASMRSEGLMGSDNLHLTQSGYKKLGGIIADDIANAVINGK